MRALFNDSSYLSSIHVKGSLIPFLIKPILFKHHFTGIGLDSQNNISWRIPIFELISHTTSAVLKLRKCNRMTST